MTKTDSTEWSSIRIKKETHDILIEKKDREGIPYAKYVEMAVKEKYDRDQKAEQENG